MFKRNKLSILVLLFVFSLFSRVAAQTESKGVFGPESGPIVSEAQGYQKLNQHKSAIKNLKKALKIKGLTPYEESTIHIMLGGSYHSLGDTKKAVGAFEGAIDSGGLTETQVKTFQANIAQLNILSKKYALGAEQLETYFSEGGERKPNLIKLLLIAHYENEDYQKARPWAKVMLEDGIVETRTEYDSLLFLFDNRIDREEQLIVGNKMLKLWPEDKKLLFQVAFLKGKANREGVDPLVVNGFSELAEAIEIADFTNIPDRDAEAVARVPAQMPTSANKSGHCNLRHDVNEKGHVFNVRTINCTDPVFETSSVKVLKTWRFNPKIAGETAVKSFDLEQKISYKLIDKNGKLIPE